MKTSRVTPSVLALLLLSSACADEDFVDYTRVEGFRLLALSADRPEVAPTGVTALRALAVRGEDPAATFRYQWRWCPISTGSAGGFECAITQQELQMQIDEALGGRVIDVPPFELGTTSTATFSYDLPAEFFQAACDGFAMAELPPGFNLPDCTTSFPVEIRLDIESDGEFITGVREVRLAYEDGQINVNPTIESVSFVEFGSGDERAPIEPDGSTVLRRNIEYEIFVDVPDDDPQMYQAPPIVDGDPPTDEVERLTVTWFSESGTIDRTRTGFIDGESTFETLEENMWISPKKVDYPAETTRLFFVVRDNRGGTSWAERTVRFED